MATPALGLDRAEKTGFFEGCDNPRRHAARPLALGSRVGNCRDKFACAL
jgi:hypothetical protein